MMSDPPMAVNGPIELPVDQEILNDIPPEKSPLELGPVGADEPILQGKQMDGISGRIARTFDSMRDPSVAQTLD